MHLITLKRKRMDIQLFPPQRFIIWSDFIFPYFENFHGAIYKLFQGIFMSENPEHSACYFQQYALDPQYGYNIPQDYKPQYFNKAPIFEALDKLHEKIKNKTVHQACSNLPALDLSYLESGLDSFTKWRDSIYLQGLLADLLHALINQQREQGKKDDEIVVPFNLGYPIYKLSKCLDIKQGMGGEFYINWRLKNNKKHTDNLEVQDLDRPFHFVSPQNQVDEDMFFGCSVIGSEYLFRSIKLLYQIKTQLEVDPLNAESLCIRNLRQIKKNIEHINQCNFYLNANINPVFIGLALRKFFKGFKDISIEFFDKKLTACGGAGGFDPCFQILERFLGIKYTGGLAKSQQVFRSGFPTPIKKLIDKLDEYSIIRQYCEIVPAMKRYYNDVIKQYSYFYIIHRHLIMNFAMPKDPKASTTGAAGVDLKVIIQRYQAIQDQCL